MGFDLVPTFERKMAQRLCAVRMAIPYEPITTVLSCDKLS